VTTASQAPPRRYRFDDLVVDSGQRKLWRGEDEIRLSRLSFDFLVALVEAAPNLLTHDELVEAVWGPRRVVTPENLSQRLRMLRQALGYRAEEPRYIEAVRGQGYRLIGDVQADPVPPPARRGFLNVTRPEGTFVHPPSPTGRRLTNAVFGLLVMAVGLMAVGRYYLPVPPASERARELYSAGVMQPHVGDQTRALQLLDDALAIDAKLVDAWLEKAFRHDMRSAGMPSGFAEERGLALEAAREALRLDPDSPRAVAAVATVRASSGKWVDAEHLFRDAKRNDLESASLLVTYGAFQMMVGHYERARAALASSLDSEPNDQAETFLLTIVEVVGDLEARQHELEQGKARYKDWPFFYDEMFLALGRRNTAQLRALLPFSAGLMKRIIALGVANLDSPREGLAALHELYVETEQWNSIALFGLSAWAAYFDDPALSIQWLTEAVNRAPSHMGRVWLPVFDDVRREPAFEPLIRDQGLPEYWDEFGWPSFCRRTSGDEFECH
jgi:DNA-binding winged helix-turn-helix (wHTH) protein/Tfp pilus assembly protein PilF